MLTHFGDMHLSPLPAFSKCSTIQVLYELLTHEGPHFFDTTIDQL